MATISMADNGTSGHLANSANTKVPYVITNRVDIAAAVTAKGSALAASDVIEALDIPANTMVVSAWMRVETATTGSASDVTIDLGFTGGNVDNFADGFDLDAAAAGDYSALPVTAPVIVGGTADTLDMLIATQTGTLLTGEVDVCALVVDISELNAPGIATRD